MWRLCARSDNDEEVTGGREGGGRRLRQFWGLQRCGIQRSRATPLNSKLANTAYPEAAQGNKHDQIVVVPCYIDNLETSSKMLRSVSS